MRYEDGSKLSSWLDLYVMNFEAGYRKHWGLDSAEPPLGMEHSDWILAKKVDVVFGKIVEAAVTLEGNEAVEELTKEIVRVRQIDSVTGSETFRGGGPGEYKKLLESDVVDDRLEILLAYQALSKWEDAKARFIILFGFLRDGGLGHRARAYLSRVTELFLWGFHVESVVMAAAVVEVALHDTIEGMNLKAPLAPRGERNSWTFAELISAAETRLFISRAQARFAHQLRLERNAIIHSVPVNTTSTKDVIAGTVDLLNALDRIHQGPKS